MPRTFRRQYITLCGILVLLHNLRYKIFILMIILMLYYIYTDCDKRSLCGSVFEADIKRTSEASENTLVPANYWGLEAFFVS